MSLIDSKVCILGDGFVGQSLKNALHKCNNVVVLGPQEVPVQKVFDICFVCVPTNNTDGVTDLSNIEDAFLKIKSNLYIIKSTVPLGTCKQLTNRFKVDIVYCPEFLSESTYHNPTNCAGNLLEWPFFVLGGSDRPVDSAYNFLLEIFGPCKSYSFATFETAELFKYTVNLFWTFKLSFFNSIFDVCTDFNVDYKKLRELVLLDKRIHPLHTAIFKNKRGFRGKCLPKDLESFISQIKNKQSKDLFAMIQQYNNLLIKN